MKEFTCCICNKKFNRYASTVKNKKFITCSRQCYSVRQKDLNKGKNNPNFKKGNYLEPSYCACGKVKDFRSNFCSICSNTSHSLNYLYEDSDIEIKLAIALSKSFIEAASKVKSSRKALRQYQQSNNIDISHFNPANNRPISNDNLFVISDKKRYQTVKKRIIRDNLKPYQCSNKKCVIESTWIDNPLVLDLDHINGNPYDNRLENLRFLCPNCHSQTKTYKGKRGKERR